MGNSQAESTQQHMNPLSVKVPERGNVERGIIELTLGWEKLIGANRITKKHLR